MSSEELKRLFIIAPIGSEESDTRIRLEKLQKYIVEPSCEKFGYICERADQLPRAGTITTHIIECLMEYELVIADLSDLNPNVFYELAVRHAVNKPVILIAEKGTKIPFDISHERVIFYSTDVEDSYKAQEMLHRLIENVESDEYENESPLKTKIQIETTKITSEIEAIEKIYEKIDKLYWEIKSQSNKEIPINISNLNDDLYQLILRSNVDTILYNLKLTERQKKIMRYIADHAEVEPRHLLLEMQFPRVSLYRILSELNRIGLIQKSTRDGKTTYILSKLATLLPQLYE